MTGVLVRELSCAVCGAPRKTASDAIVVLCVHCGALLAHDGEGLWRDAAVAERHAEGIRGVVRPTAAEARLARLGVELDALRGPEDRTRWRLLAEEQVLLLSVVHPELAAPLPSEPAARARHLAESVALQEIATFDGSVRRAAATYGAISGELVRAGDPIEAARRMVDAAHGYWRALAAHPDAPPGALREGADRRAREMVRQVIAGYASLLGAGVVERIRVEVLGDVLVHDGAARCPRCGAPLGASHGLVRCRHCDAVTSTDGEDAWTAARLALWKVTLAELVRDGKLDGPSPVIAAVGSFLYTPAANVPADRAFAFLTRAIPWVARDDLAAGLDILSGAAGTGEQRRLVDALRAEVPRWQADPRARPAPPVAPASFDPPSPDEEAAWVEAALSRWAPGRGTLLDLLGHPLVAMHLAALHGERTGVSARAALAFFERATPGFDRAAMLAEVRRIQPGYDHPRVAAFTAELCDLLSA